MSKIIVTERFPFSPDGCRVVWIEEGPQEVSERCAQVALRNDWARRPAPVSSKKTEGPTNKQLADELRELGVDVPKRANKDQLTQLLEEARAKAGDGGEGDDDSRDGEGE